MSGNSGHRIAAHAAALGIATALALLGSAASAQVTDAQNPFLGKAPGCFVYHSRDGDGFYDFTRILPVGSHMLGLWATAGATTTAEPSCEPGPQPGTGEICVVSFAIEKTGAGSLDGFAFSGGIAGGSSLSPDGSILTVNITAATDPLPGGFVPGSAPVRIGDLSLTVGSDTTVSLTDGSCLSLGAESRSVPTHVIFLPEPTDTLLLAAGVLGLVGLHGLRKRLARGR